MNDSPRRDIGISLTSDPDVTRIDQPQTSGARPVVDLPLRMLLVSDLAPQNSAVDWSGQSRLVSVDRNSFDELIQQLAPQLEIEVPNTISGSPKMLDVRLEFKSLQDFHPLRVVEQIPELEQLLEIRTLVSRVKSGDLDMETLREKLSETSMDAEWAEQVHRMLAAPPRETPSATQSAPPAEASDDDAVDRLLGMVDLGGNKADEQPAEDAPTEERGFIAALVQAVTGASAATTGVEKPAVDLLIDDLDNVVGAQLNAILGHRAFRTTEAAWRGLKLMVDRINFRANVRLDVLAAGKDDLSDALYHQVLLPEHSDETDRAPLSALILDFAFASGQADVALLEDLAETGNSLQIPVITSADSSFFGVAEPAGLEKLPLLRHHLEEPQYIAWNKLRAQDNAKHLALALPPLLLRGRYGPEHPVGAFNFDEAGQLYGGAALAVAIVMASSFVKTGWPTHLQGNGEYVIDNLPVRTTGGGSTPLAALLSETKQSDLADAGFVVLGSRRNHDAAYIVYAPTSRYTDTYDTAVATEEARAHNSLPSQLFVSRAAHFLLVFQNEITPGTGIADVEAELTSRLKSLLGTVGESLPDGAVSVDHLPEAQLPDHDVLRIRLRPPRSVLNKPVDLVMALQVRK